MVMILTTYFLQLRHGFAGVSVLVVHFSMGDDVGVQLLFQTGVGGLRHRRRGRGGVQLLFPTTRVGGLRFSGGGLWASFSARRRKTGKALLRGCGDVAGKQELQRGPVLLARRARRGSRSLRARRARSTRLALGPRPTATAPSPRRRKNSFHRDRAARATRSTQEQSLARRRGHSPPVPESPGGRHQRRVQEWISSTPVAYRGPLPLPTVEVDFFRRSVRRSGGVDKRRPPPQSAFLFLAFPTRLPTTKMSRKRLLRLLGRRPAGVCSPAESPFSSTRSVVGGRVLPLAPERLVLLPNLPYCPRQEGHDGPPTPRSGTPRSGRRDRALCPDRGRGVPDRGVPDRGVPAFLHSRPSGNPHLPPPAPPDGPPLPAPSLELDHPSPPDSSPSPEPDSSSPDSSSPASPSPDSSS